MRTGRVFRNFTIFACGSLGAWTIVAKLIAPPLIRSAYGGESFAFLNEIIQGQSEHPVEHYLASMNEIFFLGLAGLILVWTVIGLGWWVVAKGKIRKPLRATRRWIGTLPDKWEDFWFRPSAPTDLAINRIVAFGLLFLIYRPVRFSYRVDVSPVFWIPIKAFQYLHVPQLSSDTVRLMESGWKLSLVCCCLGFMTRISTMLCFLLGAYLIPLTSAFGKFNHQHNMPFLVIAIMAFSRCGDAWSVDRVIQRWCRGGAELKAMSSGEYTWPIRLVWVNFVIAFFAAGVAKLTAPGSGLGWASGDNLSYYITTSHYGVEAAIVTQLGLWVAQHYWLCTILGAASLLFETGAPLALFSRSMRLIFVPGLLMMQIGIWILMGTFFKPYITVYQFWIPWSSVGSFAFSWALHRRQQPPYREI